MRHDVYLKLPQVADRIHPLLRLALVVAEGTGRRISAWRNLKPSAIRWRAEFDKKRFEDVVPMSDTVSGRVAGGPEGSAGDRFRTGLPAPKDPTKPCDRHLLDSWLRRAFKAAKLTPERGGLWHSLRRKRATERKGHSLKGVAAAGGWRDEGTTLTSYQQVDAETIKRVVLNPTMRLAKHGR